MRRTWIFAILFLFMGSTVAWAAANRAPAGWGTQLSARHGGHHLHNDRVRKIRARRSKVAPSKTSNVKTTSLAAGDPVLFGDQTVESTHDSNAAGNPQAFAFANSTNGTTGSISVYVDSGSTVGKLYAGLYTDNNGHPGSLLVSGSLASPKSGAWNNVTVPSATVSSGKTYWLAVLGTGSAASSSVTVPTARA